MTELPIESVWDYPRPPRVERSDEHVVVTHRGVVVCDTTRALRVLETSHPPAYYLPVEDCAHELFVAVPGSTICEFKGVASYYDLVVDGETLPRVAWRYLSPHRGFEEIAQHVALYPGRVDSCTVNGESVVAQEGDFYGGWITSRIHGPFKGGPGTLGW